MQTNFKSRKKRRPKEVLPKNRPIEAPHKPNKSIPLQDTSDEDMLYIRRCRRGGITTKKPTPVNEIEKFSDEWWRS
ncbi:hypothetical protein TNCV_2165511 [Trichonephila clavipes]|nr:hypothetical protein TNCV_2165511 [Trichonephila clavipes]